jgi:hypothetical protein
MSTDYPLEPCTMCGETDECMCYTEIIHDACGLNVELCVCPDAEWKFNHETGMMYKSNNEDNHE